MDILYTISEEIMSFMKTNFQDFWILGTDPKQSSDFWPSFLGQGPSHYLHGRSQAAKPSGQVPYSQGRVHMSTPSPTAPRGILVTLTQTVSQEQLSL